MSCEYEERQPPSFPTFLRALGQVKCLRMRKSAGQHPNCDLCVLFKKQLRAAKGCDERRLVLDDYCKHLLDQWLDRQADGNNTEVSLACRRLLDNGQLLANLGRDLSHVVIRIDGVDQAKFRVPRVLRTTHDFDKLVRPALHVQGAWCHGFCFHLAVSDADMKKDSNNNMEVLARVLEDLHVRHGAVPRSIYLIQDNTSRECKNQRVIKFATRLVAMGVVDQFEFAFPEKGHTHGPLDGTYGQLCVKLACREFQDDLEVVEILGEFVEGVGIDRGSRCATRAYKLDEAARWDDWCWVRERPPHPAGRIREPRGPGTRNLVQGGGVGGALDPLARGGL